MFTGSPFGAEIIWGGTEANPVNAWRYFRYVFNAPQRLVSAVLHIAADTTYELFVNGRFVGRGPARGYPFNAYYDRYAIERCLHPGQDNCVAILVNHLGDHTLSYMRSHPGLLCQIRLQDLSGDEVTIGTGSDWRTLDSVSIKAHTPRISFQMEFEEQVDARFEPDGWQVVGFDDTDWEAAHIVETAPWTRFEPRPIPYLTDNVVTPHAIKAVELARIREGYRWSFDVRHLAGTSRRGMKSAPEGERGWIVFTEIEAETPCIVRIHTFPNYEMIPIRINDESFEAVTPDQAVTLRAGRNLVMLRSPEFPALLFETDAKLQFGAERFVPGAVWAFAGVLNELNGDLQRCWTISDLDGLRGQVPMRAIHQEDNCEDIFMLTATQQFFAVEGGFCAAEIHLPTPRFALHGRRTVIDNAGACLHSSPEAAIVFPQPDGDVHLVIDFGREIIGYIELEVDASAGAIIDANCFEGIDETGIFWTTNLRNSFRYVCREGHQVFVSHRRRGFRYLSLTLRDMKRPLLIHGIRTRVSTYPVEHRGSFQCSDEVLNQIWAVAAYTVQLCMLDTYTDCPAYEQAFWVGDARNSALVNAVAFGAHELTTHCIELAALSLSDHIDAVKPSYIQREHLVTSHIVSGWFNEIPMWTFLWVWMVYEHYLYTGDREMLGRHYPAVKLCLARCEQFLSKRDLFAISDVWNLVDWAALDLEDEGEVVANTAMMARALDCAAEMAATLGIGEDEDHSKQVAERLRSALNRYTWSYERQGYVDTLRDHDAYTDYCQRMQSRGLMPDEYAVFRRKERISECTNTLMLLCKCVPAERHASVLRYVLAAKDGRFRSSGPHEAHLTDPDEVVPVGSPWFLFFTLETLFSEAHADVALKIVREQWKRMLDKGATTFWEMFPAERTDDQPVHWSRSLCHGWSAAPAYFLSSKVLGVVPLTPGYAKVRIQPQTLGLEWAQGTVPTIHGDIFVRWRRHTSGKLDLTFSAPAAIEVVTETEHQEQPCQH